MVHKYIINIQVSVCSPDKFGCVKSLRNTTFGNCLSPCEGVMVTYYDKEEYNDTSEDTNNKGLMKLFNQYNLYKGIVDFPPQLKKIGNIELYCWVLFSDVFSYRLFLQKQI